MRTPALLVSAAIILTGCLTTQENPNYEYSSRYNTQGQTQVAQTAHYTAPAPTQVVYETQTVPAPQTESIQTVDVIMQPSPTGAEYADGVITGTPGYMATLDQPITVTIQSAQSAETLGPQAVNYDYSQNLVRADAAIATPDLAPEIRILPSAGQDYTVQQGDTIYGLSRKNCVGVDVIRGMNTIGADYGIQIGQTIKLPESRC
ncbi:LysM peptidoglycan-binding domain-containing protein [Litorimonas sp. WD9-15]|uniref:LysM peptidoglycan-binding domain-containing protein n=1 Tax=Litorimonas sp. WD9-15 TaxID=3418716 RepID=UPI003D056E8E